VRANPEIKNPAASFEAPGAPFRDDEMSRAFDQTRQQRFSGFSFVHGTSRGQNRKTCNCTKQMRGVEILCGG
jgi:hypothetical protein